jgi:hypothetical protein
MTRARLVACAALALAAAHAQGASKMFKCVEGGRTIYQQQACAVVAEPASAPRAAAKASAAVASASADVRVRQALPAASSAPAARR